MRGIIQVGLGNMGQAWADCIGQSNRWEVAAYVDVNPKLTAAAAERHGMPRSRCFKDLREAMSVVEADAVLDATPPQARLDVCLAAMEGGLAVLCEKPLADTLPNAVRLVKTAELFHCTLMAAQNYRYQPAVQTVKAFIAKGRLGAVGHVGVNFHKGPHFGGYREEMEFPLLFDMSIHHFDMMRCMLSADVEAVQAVSGGGPWNWYAGAPTVSATLEMRNGVMVNYFASWISRGWETDWNGDWRIEGEKGVLMLEKGEVFFADKPSSRRKLPCCTFPKTHQAWLIDAFAESLDKKREPETSGRNNLNSLAAVHAAALAARERRRIAISEILDRP